MATAVGPSGSRSSIRLFKYESKTNEPFQSRSFFSAILNQPTVASLFEEIEKRIEQPLKSENDLKDDIKAVQNFLRSSIVQEKLSDKKTKCLFIEKICQNYKQLDVTFASQRELNAYDCIILDIIKNATHDLYEKMPSLEDATRTFLQRLSTGYINLDLGINIKNIYFFYREFSIKTNDLREFLSHKKNIQYIINNPDLRKKFIDVLDHLTPRFRFNPLFYLNVYRNLYDICSNNINFPDHFLLTHVAYFAFKILRDIYFGKKYALLKVMLKLQVDSKKYGELTPCPFELNGLDNQYVVCSDKTEKKTIIFIKDNMYFVVVKDNEFFDSSIEKFIKNGENLVYFSEEKFKELVTVNGGHELNQIIYQPSPSVQKKLDLLIKHELAMILLCLDKNSRLAELEQANPNELEPAEREVVNCLKTLGLFPATKKTLNKLFDEKFDLSSFEFADFKSDEILDALFGKDIENPIQNFIYQNKLGVDCVLKMKIDLERFYKIRSHFTAYSEFEVFTLNALMDKLPISYSSLLDAPGAPKYLSSYLEDCAYTVAEQIGCLAFDFLKNLELLNAFGIGKNVSEELQKLGIQEAFAYSFLNPYDKHSIPIEIKLKLLDVFNDVKLTPMFKFLMDSIFNHPEAKYLVTPTKFAHVYYTEDENFDYRKLAQNSKDCHQFILFKCEENIYKLNIVTPRQQLIEIISSPNTQYCKELEQEIKKSTAENKTHYLEIEGDKFYCHLPIQITREELSTNYPKICAMIFDEILRDWIIFPEKILLESEGGTEIKKELIHLINTIGKTFVEIVEPKLKEILTENYQRMFVYYMLSMAFLSLSSDKGLGIDNQSNGNISINIFRFLGAYFLAYFVESISAPKENITSSELQDFLNTSKTYLIRSFADICSGSIVGSFEVLMKENAKHKLNPLLELRISKLSFETDNILTLLEIYKDKLNQLIEKYPSLKTPLTSKTSSIDAELHNKKNSLQERIDHFNKIVCQLNNELNNYIKLRLNTNTNFDPLDFAKKIVSSHLTLGKGDKYQEILDQSEKALLYGKYKPKYY